MTSGKIAETFRTAQLDLSSLDMLLKVFLRSMRDRAELDRCIENIAAGNVRLALELVRGFFGSGHVDTQKIIKIGGGYRIPLHEFQRAIIYGDSVHYDPGRSPIANLFDISSADPKAHFLQSILLSYVKAPVGEASAEGFVPIQAIYSYLQGVGYLPEQIDVAVSKAYNKRLAARGGIDCEGLGA